MCLPSQSQIVMIKSDLYQPVMQESLSYTCAIHVCSAPNHIIQYVHAYLKHLHSTRNKYNYMYMYMYLFTIHIHIYSGAQLMSFHLSKQLIYCHQSTKYCTEQNFGMVNILAKSANVRVRPFAKTFLAGILHFTVSLSEAVVNLLHVN